MDAYDACHYYDIGERKAAGKLVEQWEESVFHRLNDETRREWEANLLNGGAGLRRPLMYGGDHVDAV
jgi:arginase family enzyme